MIRKIVFALCCATLLSCGDYEGDYDRGFGDGHAAGYNTTCEIRTTLISGDWDNKGYSDGYADGYDIGASECKQGIKY